MSHAASLSTFSNPLRTLALVGHPNVGKSVLFHRLTGTYVTVSNYPGTTVEVSRATPRFDREVSLLDTPGVLALPSRSDDERATMRALLNENMRTLIQVGDAKNLRRTLNLTALLAELGVPMVLALNMSDEARARGVTVDTATLAEALALPVVATVATGGEGMGALTDALARAAIPAPLLRYDEALESQITAVEDLILTHCPHPLLAARYLIDRVDAQSRPASGRNSRGAELLYRADRGGFHVLGYAGMTTQDHFEHFYAAADLLRQTSLPAATRRD